MKNVEPVGPPRLDTLCRAALALVAGWMLVPSPSLHAANPPVTQTYYVPFPEDQLLVCMTNIWYNRVENPGTTPPTLKPQDPLSTYVSISVPLAGTVIYYDQWEDGYENNLSESQQATTQIWGDGNLGNGVAPGYPSDVLPAGSVIILFNDVVSTTLQSVIDYDGRDKIGASKGIAVTRTGWSTGPETLMAGSLEVFRTGLWGTDYRAPVGQNIPNDPGVIQEYQFEFVALVISAGPGGAKVKVDINNDGDFTDTGEAEVTLAEGQSKLVAGGVYLGAHVVSDKPVQVVLFAGDKGSQYETRDSSLLPTSAWGSSYYTPVSTDTSVSWPGFSTAFTPGTVVWLYNPPGNGQITVKHVRRVGSGSLTSPTSITIADNSYARVALVQEAGYRFYTEGSPAKPFYAWSCTDAITTQADTDGGDTNTGDQVNQAWDWGFSLLPADFLSPQVVCGLGIGRDPTTTVNPNENGNPVWITPVGNGDTAVNVYVDYDGDGVGSLTDPNGNKYDVLYSLKELQQQKVFDTDGDQTGLRAYVLTSGVKLVGAWGQDPTVASPSTPGLDVGTSIPPVPLADAGKTATVVLDADLDGEASPSDRLEYDIRIVNAFLGALTGPFVVKDELPADTAYVAGSTKYRVSSSGGTVWGAWTAIADNGSGTAFPLDGSGYSIATPTTLAKGEQIQVVFQVTIDSYGNLDPNRTAIVNTGQVELPTYSLIIPITADTPLHGSLGDRVWNDVDNDGIQGGGEAGINEVRVYLDTDGSGSYEVGEPTAVTAGDGNYLISGLEAGTYTVRIVTSTLPAGYGPTYDVDLPFPGTATANVATVVLAGGQDRTDVDFGYRSGASLGDRVWLDRDNGGDQDPGEPGINGVRVYIDSNNSNTYDAGEPNDITAGDGEYYIGGLAAGTYNVRVDTTTLPAGLAQTYDLNGGLDHEASVPLAALQDRTDVDFGYKGSYSLGDRVWNDTDGDGVQDSTEASGGINGVRVFIDVNGDGLFQSTEPNAMTAGSGTGAGAYTIGGLPPGTYTVRVDPPAGYAQTYDLDGVATANVASVTIVDANLTNVDFGYRDRASLGDQVWLDKNGNQSKDDGEPGINGVRVYIDSNGDNAYTVGETYVITAGDGDYTIANLAAGNYDVRVDTTTLPDGVTQTHDLNGALDNEATAVSLTANQDRTDVDFGYRGTGQIGNQVWTDTNNDGLLNDGETGINGVAVQLFQQGKIPGTDAPYATTTTATVGPDAGVYSFSNLPAGNYFVYLPTPPSAAPLSSMVTDTADNQQDNDDNGSQTGGSGAPVQSPVIALAAGETDNTVDFGFVAPATMGNQVWLDTDNDGLLDIGEVGIDGVQVQLYQAGKLPGTDAPYATTTTATVGPDAGIYAFTSLPAGNYFVYIPTPPAGAPWSSFPTDTSDNQQDADDNGSQESLAPGHPVSSPVIALDPGETDNTIDFGFVPDSSLGSIGNQVWEDLDNDGELDTGTETGINEVEVTLNADLDGDGAFDGPGEQGFDTVITSGDGNYTFADLPPGRYQVVILSPPASAPMASSVVDPDDNNQDNDNNGDQPDGPGLEIFSPAIVLGVGEDDATVDFGLLTPATLGNQVWADTNYDGVLNGSEIGINGVVVILDADLNNDGDFADPGESGYAEETTATVGPEDGVYLFENLPPGNYRVRIPIPPAGYPLSSPVTDTADNQEEDDDNGVQTDGSGTAVVSPVIQLSSGEDDTTIDFGFVPSGLLATLGNQVWEDTDGDGALEAGEPGLNGVTVLLYQAGSTPGVDPAYATTTTSGNGNYSFTVLPGQYFVYIPTPPAGAPRSSLPTDNTPLIDNNDNGIQSASGQPASSSVVTLASGENNPTIDFGFVPITSEDDLAQLGNQVWADTNNDGILAGESGINGVIVQLFSEGANPLTDTPLGTQTTSGNGNYLFAGIPVGNYFVYLPAANFTGGGALVSHALSSTVTATTDNQTDNDDNGTQAASGEPVIGPVVALAGGESDNTIDFGFIPADSLASLGDFVWDDADSDGIQDGDPEEPGFAGVTVRLHLASDDSVVATAITADGSGTDPLGFYEFTGLAPGVGYYLEFVLPPGVGGFSPATLGGDSTLDSNVGEAGNHGAGTTATITLAAGEYNITIDAGIKPPTPTAALLAYFQATTSGGKVVLRWQTLVEVRTLGFRVERQTAAGAWERTDTAVIPAQGLDLRPHAYELTDDGADRGPGKYRLVEVERNGSEQVLAEATVLAQPRLTLTAAGSKLVLRLEAPVGSTVVIQSAATAQGPWASETSVTVGSADGLTVNVQVESVEARFYRALVP